MEYLQDIVDSYEKRLENYKKSRQRIIDEMKLLSGEMGKLYIMELIKFDAAIEEIEGLLDYVYYLIEQEEE